MTTKKAAAPAKTNAAIPGKFDSVTETHSTTEPLILLVKGKAQIGYYVKHNIDMNAQHIQAKAGEGYFVDQGFVKIATPVKNWIAVSDLAKHLGDKPADKAEVPAK